MANRLGGYIVYGIRWAALRSRWRPFTLEVGKHMLMGYPLEETRRLINKTQDFQSKFAALFSEELSLMISPDVANDMAAAGWERHKVEEAVASGMRYSPSRTTVLTPMIRGGFGDGFDAEFDDE